MKDHERSLEEILNNDNYSFRRMMEIIKARPVSQLDGIELHNYRKAWDENKCLRKALKKIKAHEGKVYNGCTEVGEIAKQALKGVK